MTTLTQKERIAAVEISSQGKLRKLLLTSLKTKG